MNFHTQTFNKKQRLKNNGILWCGFFVDFEICIIYRIPKSSHKENAQTRILNFFKEFEKLDNIEFQFKSRERERERESRDFLIFEFLTS